MRKLLLFALLVAGCARPDSASLVEGLADHRNGRMAADELERREDPETEAALLEGLRSRSPSVRSHCIRLLLDKNPPQFERELERLLGDEHVAVSREAARALVKLRSDEELLTLVKDPARTVQARQLVAHQMSAQHVQMGDLQERWLEDATTPLPLRVEAAGWWATSHTSSKCLRDILQAENQPAELRAAARIGLGLPRDAHMIDNREHRQRVEQYRPRDVLTVSCLARCPKGSTIRAQWKGPGGLSREDSMGTDRDFASFYFWQAPEPTPWPVGAYTVEVWVNDERADGCTVPFRVVKLVN